MNDDMIGRRFGMLVVQAETDPVPDSRGHMVRQFICLCDCGKERTVRYNVLVQGNINSCGCTRFPKKPPIDLTGKTFGKLTVLSEAEVRIQKSGHRSRQWNCICECGKETTVLQSNLLSSHGTRSCGCLQESYYSIRAKSVPDLTGNRYGRLIVLSKAETTIGKNGSRRYNWLCHCDCGNDVIVIGSNLIYGHTRSCGCLRGRRRSIETIDYNDLTGRRYGKLTVLSEAAPHVDKDGMKRRSWLCRCDCGNEKVVINTNLTLGHTRSCGCMRGRSIKGQKFGMLTALCKVADKSKKHFWNCRCDCGNKVVVSWDDLYNDTVTSCGCQEAKRRKSRQLIDLTGQTFTRLTVIREADRVYTKQGKTVRTWLCRCECGREVVVRHHNLTRKVTRSCGCLKRERRRY